MRSFEAEKIKRTKGGVVRKAFLVLFLGCVFVLGGCGVGKESSASPSVPIVVTKEDIVEQAWLHGEELLKPLVVIGIGDAEGFKTIGSGFLVNERALVTVEHVAEAIEGNEGASAWFPFMENMPLAKLSLNQRVDGAFRIYLLDEETGKFISRQNPRYPTVAGKDAIELLKPGEAILTASGNPKRMEEFGSPLGLLQMHYVNVQKSPLYQYYKNMVTVGVATQEEVDEFAEHSGKAMGIVDVFYLLFPGDSGSPIFSLSKSKNEFILIGAVESDRLAMRANILEEFLMKRGIPYQK